MIEIRIMGGAEARDLVDPFYSRNSRNPCARDEDVFFLAMDGGTLLGCVRYCVEDLAHLMPARGLVMRGWLNSRSDNPMFESTSSPLHAESLSI